MEKKTILAVVLSTIVLIGSFILQGYFATKRQPVKVEPQQPLVTAVETEDDIATCTNTTRADICTDGNKNAVFNQFGK